MASQKGGSGFGLMIGLIVAIFMIIGLIYLVFSNNSAFHQAEDRARQAESAAEEARQSEIKWKRELNAVNNLVHGSSNTVNIDLINKDYLKGASGKLNDVLGLEALAGEQFAKDLAKDGKLVAKEYKALIEPYGDFFVEINACIQEVNRMRVDKAHALAELETARATSRKEKTEIESSLEKERKEKADLNAKLLEDAKNFDQERRRLLEEKEAVQKEIASKEEARLIAEARLESKIRELEGRITELTEKEKKTLANTEQDGEIVHSDQRLGLAWINIGQKHRLRRGITFDVFQYVKGGVKKSKGKVEVKSVDDETAQVAIVSQTDPSDPIVKGDYVASPFFDVKHQQVFVFVGERPSAQSRYSLDELVRRIEETGGRVDKTVTIDTDFIIAIENAEQSDEFAKAVQFGVVIMREPELLEYLGR
jgi:hypothetical protein